MKPLLLACLLLSATAGFSQEYQPNYPAPKEPYGEAPKAGVEMPEPFKGANTILIHTPDSSDVALKKMARALVLAGIEPDKFETEIGYLTTKGKAVGQLTPAVFDYKVVSSPEHGGTLLTITGGYTVRMNLANTMSVPMFWAKGNLTQGKQCFVTIESVALAYPKGRIGYLQRSEKPIIRQRL